MRRRLLHKFTVLTDVSPAALLCCCRACTTPQPPAASLHDDHWHPPTRHYRPTSSTPTAVAGIPPHLPTHTQSTWHPSPYVNTHPTCHHQEASSSNATAGADLNLDNDSIILAGITSGVLLCAGMHSMRLHFAGQHAVQSQLAHPLVLVLQYADLSPAVLCGPPAPLH